MSDRLAASKLNELMVKRGIQIPKYEELPDKWETGSNINKFVIKVISPIVANGKNYEMEGTGLSKKEAKNQAAYNFIQKYLTNDLTNMKINKGTPEVQTTVNTSLTCAVNITDKNKNALLQTLCSKYEWGKPEFEEVETVGPPHSRRFTVRCNVSNFNADGKGTTKAEAKLQAATKMIQCLMQEAEVIEIFESPRITPMADTSEIICLNENLKGSQNATPIGIFGRRSSSSSSSSSSRNSSIGSCRINGNINIPSSIIKSNDNCKKVDNIAESSDDSASNMSLIDFDDNYQPQTLGNFKTKSKSMNNLSEVEELDKWSNRMKAVNKIEKTLKDVEKQLYNEILDTLENRELPRAKTVVILSHEYQVFINNEPWPKIFEGNQKCTDSSIRIACLTKILMDMQIFVTSNSKKFE